MLGNALVIQNIFIMVKKFACFMKFENVNKNFMIKIPSLYKNTGPATKVRHKMLSKRIHLKNKIKIPV